LEIQPYSFKSEFTNICIF